VKLDESSQLAEFRVVEPPRVSPTPVFPGRLHLAGGAVLLALLAGIGVALVLDLLRPTLDDAKALEQISGRPVLGSVSLSKTLAWQQWAKKDRIRVAGATALLLTFQMGWVSWFVVRSLAR
jgi:hypothetical protein